MNNKLEIFEFEDKEIRTQVDSNGNPWFCVKDVCDTLGLTNSRKSIENIDKDDVTTSYIIDSLGRKQNANFVNESGLYQLIFQSRKQEAKSFKKWITSEVLPSIRKTGSYSITPQKLDSYQIEDPIERAQRWIEECEEKMLLLDQSKKLSQKVEELKPKEEFYDSIMVAKDSIYMKTVANVLDCGLGRNQLFELLRIHEIVNHKNEPYQRFIDQGLFEVSLYAVKIGNSSKMKSTTLVTPKGIEYINKLVKNLDNL